MVEVLCTSLITAARNTRARDGQPPLIAAWLIVMLPAATANNACEVWEIEKVLEWGSGPPRSMEIWSIALLRVQKRTFLCVLRWAHHHYADDLGS